MLIFTLFLGGAICFALGFCLVGLFFKEPKRRQKEEDKDKEQEPRRQKEEDKDKEQKPKRQKENKDKEQEPKRQEEDTQDKDKDGDKDNEEKTGSSIFSLSNLVNSFGVLVKRRNGGMRHIVILLYVCFTVGNLSFTGMDYLFFRCDLWIN